MRRQRGFAYVEALVAVVLVAMALVPALDALESASLNSQALADAGSRDAQLRAKMEEVLSKPFATLNAETYVAGANTTTAVSAALSDAAGPTRRIVIVYRWDGTALTAGDVGLVRVRVAWESGGLGLEVLRSKWF
jgi:Tfp pilus assembly protein PilV